MAQGYVPIQTITLTGNSSSVDFTNIPQNYTDLKLYISSRNNDSSAWGNILVGFNDSTSGYTNKYFQSNGAGVGVGSVAQMVGDMNTNASTANIYNNIEVYINDYTSSSNKLFYADSTAEDLGATGFQMMQANMWANSAAITKISVTNRNGGVVFVAGTKITLYGIGAHRASGGTITADSQYTYHTFTSSGTFTALEKIKSAEVLIVAGGGGGGFGSGGGGGGAGGVLYANAHTLNSASSYTIIVGAGGTGGTDTTSTLATNGSNSFYSSGLALGGGAGGSEGNGNASRSPGIAGGSGGGGGDGRNNGVPPQSSYAGGSATQTSYGIYVGYGNAGGNATYGGGEYGGGGGGGAGNAGSNASQGGGAAGHGIDIFHTWHLATNTGVIAGGRYYIAGGGGGAYQQDQDNSHPGYAMGGYGGGGYGGIDLNTNANNFIATSAVANTGSGGGGGTNSWASGGAGTVYSPTSHNGIGGNGGSGIVIIRYPN